MQVTLTLQTLITASAVRAAVLALIGAFAKVVRWMDRQNLWSAAMVLSAAEKGVLTQEQAEKIIGTEAVA